uniref:Myosin motor domain-containing protein n=1 Tax=Panagrolaimus superbus TaxID=310955 RepID=A0A914Z685_9BILA
MFIYKNTVPFFQDTVVGGLFSIVFLETSFICHQKCGERNFHIFYQLLSGADEDLAEKLGLAAPEKYEYLKYGFPQFITSSPSSIPSSRLPDAGTIADDVVDDIIDYNCVKKFLVEVGFSNDEIVQFFSIVAGILHLGNIKFELSTRGRCVVQDAAKYHLDMAAKLLGLNAEDLVLACKIGKSGGAFKVHEVEGERDALAQTIYCKLFDSIVTAINLYLGNSMFNSKAFIGVMDIKNFEFLQENAFEQFCIDYCDEKMSHISQENDYPRCSPINKEECLKNFERKSKPLVQQSTDGLHVAIKHLLANSTNNLIKFFYESTSLDPSTQSSSDAAALNESDKQSSFSYIMEQLQTTETHYVKCIKPVRAMSFDDDYN